MTNPLRAAAACLLLLLLAAGPALAAPLRVCDAGTPLTPLGLDTKAGLVLLSLPPLGGGTGWIVELPAEGNAARAFPDAGGGRSGLSVGPGPVLAALPCGPSCLQPVQWSGGRWQPLGEPFTTPAVATHAATWDATGHAWFVLHGPRQEGGRVTAWAFRLGDEGRAWEPQGSLLVAAAGEPQVVPAPQRQDGVVSGTGLFAAAASPTAWLSGIPELPAERRGQVLPLGGGGAAYLSADGAVYVSRDAGTTWRRSLWTPWGAARVTASWRQGSDYWVDLPLAAPGEALPLSWFDRRVPGEEQLYLTELDPAGRWRLVAQGASPVKTRGEETLAVSHVVVPRAGSWLVVSGCVATAEGSGLVVRTAGPSGLSAPRLVPLERR